MRAWEKPLLRKVDTSKCTTAREFLRAPSTLQQRAGFIFQEKSNVGGNVNKLRSVVNEAHAASMPSQHLFTDMPYSLELRLGFIEGWSAAAVRFNALNQRRRHYCCS